MGKGPGTIIFLIIFFAIIVVLVIVAAIGSKKDRTEKLIKNHKKRTLNNKAENQRVKIFKELYKIILDVDKEIENFKPSVGIKSLGQINIEYGKKINEIKNSKELKTVFLREDYKTEMKDIINGLSNEKPSNWNINPESQFAVNLVKVKNEALFKNIKNQEKEDEKKRT